MAKEIQMSRIKFHLFAVFTMVVLVTCFFILLSPQFEWLRTLLGLPTHLPGGRYNPSNGATYIINPDIEAAKFYLGRITFVYHSVFAILLYASLIGLSEFYLSEEIEKLVLNLSFVGALFTVAGGTIYSYFNRDFLWHGVFIVGLAIFFVVGLIILMNFRPKGLLEWNIWAAGTLILAGSIIGGWLGASFMFFRDIFLEGLITARFNPDLAEENVFFRALTAHEHAMVALALTLVFLLGLKIAKIDEDTKYNKVMLYIVLLGQVIMAVACYAVWGVGKVAHLAITPASLTLIFGTLLLSLKVLTKGLLKLSLIVGNVMMWLAVALPGALVAISLRKPIFFNPAFRDPLWDWAELAYNVGHWHILLLSWGVILMLIYIIWPENLVQKYKVMKWGAWLTLIGYSGAVLFINLYMLANGPGEYIPNAYNNVFLTYLVEPSLITMSIGIALTYLVYLLHFVANTLGILKDPIQAILKKLEA